MSVVIEGNYRGLRTCSSNAKQRTVIIKYVIEIGENLWINKTSRGFRPLLYAFEQLSTIDFIAETDRDTEATTLLIISINSNKRNREQEHIEAISAIKSKWSICILLEIICTSMTSPWLSLPSLPYFSENSKTIFIMLKITVVILNFGRNLATLSSVHWISMKFASSLEKNIAFPGNAQSDSEKCGNYFEKS